MKLGAYEKMISRAAILVLCIVSCGLTACSREVEPKTFAPSTWSGGFAKTEIASATGQRGIIIKHAAESGEAHWYAYTARGNHYAELTAEPDPAGFSALRMCFGPDQLPEKLANVVDERKSLWWALDALAGKPPRGAALPAWAPSPSGRYLAVLSAKKKGGLGFGGGSGVDASELEHFHQIFDIDGRRWIGRTVELPLRTLVRTNEQDEGGRTRMRGNRIEICWSPDERYILYADEKSFLVLQTGL